MANVLLIEDKLTKMLESIKVPEQFGSYEEGDAAEITNTEFWNLYCEYNAEFDNGASKCVYIIPGCSEVIKIPYEGYWKYSEYWNEEEEEWEYEDNDVFYEYENAGFGRGWDYCNAEVKMYEILKEEGLEDFFAETKFWGYDKNYYPLYTQERVIGFWNGKKGRSASENSIKKASTMNGRGIDRLWIAFAIDRYGIEKVEKLIYFLENNDHGIGYDLHNGNIGFRVNGDPIILDYAGFED